MFRLEPPKNLCWFCTYTPIYNHCSVENGSENEFGITILGPVFHMYFYPLGTETYHQVHFGRIFAAKIPSKGSEFRHRFTAGSPQNDDFQGRNHLLFVNGRILRFCVWPILGRVQGGPLPVINGVITSRSRVIYNPRLPIYKAIYKAIKL